jgi:hypothetical protein
MSSKGSQPSTRWFWWTVLLWNVYLVAILVLGSLGIQGGRVFFAPARLLWNLWWPVRQLFFQAASGKVLVAFLLSLVEWELGAVALGFVCYGVAAGVHAVRKTKQGRRPPVGWWGLVGWVGVRSPALAASGFLVYCAGTLIKDGFVAIRKYTSEGREAAPAPAPGGGAK